MATQIEPDSPVAWQGLAVLCEKQPDLSTLDESIVIYTRLTDIVKEWVKWVMSLLETVYEYLIVMWITEDFNEAMSEWFDKF